MDLNYIEKNYESMSDDEIIRIATTDARGLRPEVFKFIENEIKKRNLNPNILKGAIAQNKEYSIDEINKYSQLLRNLPCPICGSEADKLNGTISYTIRSWIIFSAKETHLTIACPDCLDEKNKDAMLSTAAFGWWGLTWGLLETPVYLYKNYKAKQENRINGSNNALLSFTLSRIGEIETYKDDKERLKEIIKPKKE